ncbi:helix-hairpin-helix domain-containing protein [Streptomyces sp. NPDC086787]|uniref:helix-hairpin-helix domain-containing protein n=1 Tax=Streptomyces sp. NPDC086787 TaxID=3365759 RepID=UPI003808AEB5
MALRAHPRAHSRSRVPSATSGPGRAPASDGRTAHRRPPSRHRARPGTEPAEDLRRRAELLFGEQAVRRRESDNGPPATEPEQCPSEPGSEPAPPDWRQRTGLAVRERLPLWLQTRCGLERRGVVALSALLVLAAVLAAQHFWTGRTQSVSAPQVVRANAPHGEENQPQPRQGGGPSRAAGPEIVVDVSGKVREPGIQHLPAGSRVADALRAAGGVRAGTSTEGLNRARFLVDGEQVVVGGPRPATGTDPAGSMSAAAGAPAPAAPVSLNTATADQLDTLPGVGPVLARHIVDYRTQHGGFRSVNELRQINGIGDPRCQC